ncbi:ATPase [Parafrankia colletiae]|uniref:ATPase n=1 Tax=Parafrankia colletiae TaxID=573497 RepID=A0A1S1RAJ8_9ACTN|nr:MoxR family ATPase [Parafrankia colletiae]MCK9900792.1 MoxR family ATPase [Frankia sp. Cpl3]OHV43210.1 ATPase [Parafrankia colletiae]
MNEWTTDPGVAASGVEVRAPAATGSAGTRRPDPPTNAAADDAALLERALFEVKKVIVGQDHMVERMLVALIARGHCLLEGVPGVAKTLAVQTLATVVGGSFVRIQFTSDLVPSDIIGTRIFRSSRETFDIELGPVFANFVLADEINRAPAKVQSALLEVMSERQVSLGGVTHPLPLPFLVLATQNPIESEGVYPLPEAQRDRFLMKVTVPYPTSGEELEIVRRMGVRPPTAEPVLDPEALLRLQHRADDVFVHHAITEYAVRLVLATRAPAEVNLPDLAGHLAYGASPRASLGLIAAARALALLRGRDYVVPDDVAAVCLDVLPHRLVLSYEALAEGLTAEEIAGRILEALPHPQIAPRQQSAADRGGHFPPPPTTHSGRWRTDPRTGFPEYFDSGPAQ